MLLGAGLFGSFIPDRARAQDRGAPLFGPMLQSDTVMAGPFDTGRLWSTAHLPVDRFRSRYGVEEIDEWRRRVQRGVVRLPTCSGALVSPQGLVLTAATCVRPFLEADTPSTSAFHPSSEDTAQPIPNLYAERVVEVAEVTDEVRKEIGIPAERAISSDSLGRVDDAVQRIRDQRQESLDDPMRVEIEREGTQYTAYTYRRYDDVRLVFLPEPQIHDFGGSENSLAYPRHRWDVAALRVYEAGAPLETSTHLSLRPDGSRPGDLAFAAGFPERGHRMGTAAQAAVLRDVVLPGRQSVLDAWIAAAEDYVESSSTAQWRTVLNEARTDRREMTALQEGLQSQYVQRRLRMKDSSLVSGDGDGSNERAVRRALLDSIAAVQEEKRQHRDAYGAFAWFTHPRYSSATLRRAWIVRSESAQRPQTPPLSEQLGAVDSQPQSVDAALLSAQLQRARSELGSDRIESLADVDLTVSAIRTRIDSSVLGPPNDVAEAVESGGVSDDDPVFQIVRPLLTSYQSFREEKTALQDRERSLMQRLTRQRVQAASLPMVRAQDRSLRVSNGTLRGYPTNGTMAPPFTTFFGLYEGYETFRPQEDWRLPSSWQGPPEALALSSPMTTVSSTDVAAGMPGGALVNEFLQVVGIITGRNERAVTGEYIFLPNRMRAVSVDVRGLVEGLRSVYDADGLVDEMTPSSEASPRESSETSR